MEEIQCVNKATQNKWSKQLLIVVPNTETELTQNKNSEVLVQESQSGLPSYNILREVVGRLMVIIHLTYWYNSKGSIPIKKCHKKWKKSTFFLTPHSPRKFWTFLNLGKIWKSKTPPPPVPNLGKIWNWENFESSEPPLKYGT